jgi:Glyoxalase-like domain
MKYRTELDHIVVACKTLGEGRAWCRETFGVEANGGGKHAGVGTHNTLLSLGTKHYLEIISIDPDAPAASFPRWFGLDTDEVKSLIAHEPRLVAWVARVSRAASAVDAVEQIAQVKDNPATIVRPAERGDFRWRFAFTREGARARGGVLPHFIQWDVPIHPCERLPDVGVSLGSLVLGDPAPEEVSNMLQAVNFSDDKVHVGQSSSLQLVATLSTPNGMIILE